MAAVGPSVAEVPYAPQRRVCGDLELYLIFRVCQQNFRSTFKQVERSRSCPMYRPPPTGQIEIGQV